MRFMNRKRSRTEAEPSEAIAAPEMEPLEKEGRQGRVGWGIVANRFRRRIRVRKSRLLLFAGLAEENCVRHCAI